MKSDVLSLLFRVLIGLFFQVTLFSRVALLGWLSPYPYLWVLLLYPVQWPRWTSLLFGFTVGLILDMFLNTGGMHASACVWVMAIRQPVLSILVPQSSYEEDINFNIEDMEIPRFATYAGILILVHHAWLFAIEIFRFSKLPTALLKSVPAAFMTLVFVMIFRMLLVKSGRKYQ